MYYELYMDEVNNYIVLENNKLTYSFLGNGTPSYPLQILFDGYESTIKYIVDNTEKLDNYYFNRRNSLFYN